MKVFKGCKKTTQSQLVPAMALNMAQPSSINSGWPCMVQQSSGPMHYNIDGATSQSQPVLSMGLNAPPPASMDSGS
ncbi:hypothetical protein QJS10_CPA03g02477 [Acorus calamus]|uniref:Uncharacterized protein n=1 Tax=Acorus calamus TaxID=4465 RepID=A0AAV9F741_ACOCL|nr:hypothetical protein QJS10_CPA03g02477 [Acorus calamus]